uniref:Putative L-type lectin-domain containing receptor kinase II.1 n=1 Tax=Davidia involucrata TaxID=16924 RepID=A0A5B7BQY2_DAVIN
MPGNLIGKGGSSQVYQGCLPDGKELAVKILKPSEDVLKEFVLEIEIITALHHKNIISLFGFCFEDNNLLLVYDFLSRGSLEENLHGSKKNPLEFGWTDRYKVAVGVAEALDYLHNRCAKPVIHRDVKSSNILLSDDFEPQLSDFGLAKWASTTTSHITCTDVAGTFGYLAPEYFLYGKVNDKIDAYAFGVVLLELLSGRKPISSDYPKGQESLVMWAKPILNGGKVALLLDPSLGNNYDPDQIERMALAATLCIRRAPRARPKMSLVLKLLQGDAEVTKWARLQVNASEGSDMLDDEAFPRSNLQSHLNLALLDVEEDSLSMSSIEQSVSLEDYLQGRWSRSSSFD